MWRFDVNYIEEDVLEYEIQERLEMDLYGYE